ncbi:MAG: EfeM/EfeO family lipoprotein [Myxococcales bacterium]|nr:EfeM/EfeO family lipoprotein [Myxococcales bacterium]
MTAAPTSGPRRGARRASALSIAALARTAARVLGLSSLLACQRPAPSAPAPDPRQLATDGVKRLVDAESAALEAQARALCAAAPAPDADGWSIAADRGAVQAMRAAWSRGRVHYERIEGAIAILFPETDLAIDGRFEHVAARRPDDDPFDAHGFVGMHAIERILWSDAIPEPVVQFERALPGWREPRTPSNATEARAFREGLCARLVEDVSSMTRALGPVALDPATAWRGVLGSVEEQAEKVQLGATGQDESRYAGSTLADMRANLEGGLRVLEAFRPWLEATPGGAAARDRIRERFERLAREYARTAGDALPDVPDGFDPDAPSAEHLQTPYGRLYALLARESDPLQPGSLAHMLRETGRMLGIEPIAR